MATIKEMAESLMPSKYCWSGDGETTLYTKAQMVEFFKDGANAVLEEIVKFADSTWGSKSLNTISLKKKIKELKGE